MVPGRNARRSQPFFCYSCQSKTGLHTAAWLIASKDILKFLHGHVRLSLLPSALAFGSLISLTKKERPILADESFLYGGDGGIRPALRGRPPRGSGVPPARHSLPLGFESLIRRKTKGQAESLSFCFGKERAKVHQAIERTPESTPL